MTWLTNGPSVVKVVDSIPYSKEAAGDWDAVATLMEASLRYALATEHERFVMSIGSNRSHLWGDNTDTNPAVVVEQPHRVLWDKTREDVSWWWLGEPEHDCDW